MATTMIAVETLVPEDVYLTLRAHGLHRQTLAEQFKRLLALYFYQKHLLSLGKAADLAAMGHWQFIDFLAENNTPVIDFSEDELEAEFSAATHLAAELK